MTNVKEQVKNILDGYKVIKYLEKKIQSKDLKPSTAATEVKNISKRLNNYIKKLNRPELFQSLQPLFDEAANIAFFYLLSEGNLIERIYKEKELRNCLGRITQEFFKGSWAYCEEAMQNEELKKILAAKK